MIDYHIHTDHSIDAGGTITEYCEQAIKIGLREICITNHCELDKKRDDNYIKFVNHKNPLTKELLLRLRDEVIRANDLNKKNGLTVRFGLEVGYYDGIESRLQEILNDINFDFVLGSIHCLDHICIDSSKESSTYFSKHTAAELMDSYFKEIEKLINSGLFDSIGHLDVYKKYGLNFYGEEIKSFPEGHLEKIFKMMAEKEIALEINTAGFRLLKEFYPAPSLMKCARDHDVKMITIGSDCHKVEDLGKGIDEGLEYSKSFGFDLVYGFDKRKPIKVEI